MARRREPLSATELRRRVVARARDRCEYCHAPQHACGYVFHLEHITPRSQGGPAEAHNRALACASCNLAKGDRERVVDPATGRVVRVYNPRRQRWDDHFSWARDGIILEGKTPTGRATVVALDMNSELRLLARRLWMTVGLLP